MRGYPSVAAWRQAIESRLATQAREGGVDLGRLRRRLVFVRLLTRLQQEQPGRWVLKGGLALEVRLGDRARTTKDLDLALRAWSENPEAIREELIDVLSTDRDGDGFQFRVAEPQRLEARDAGVGGFRFLVEAHLAGRLFERARVDVVPRFQEVVPTELVRLPDLLRFAGVHSIEVELIDRRQHFAEKLHAFTRTYGDQPSSRVKDLPDLLLLIHDGLAPDGLLRQTTERLFEARATHPLPRDLGDPPAAWSAEYSRLREELELPETTVAEALLVLRRFWASLQRK